jgi:hypothetical protein
MNVSMEPAASIFRVPENVGNRLWDYRMWKTVKPLV